jgi:hypothetical protein
MPLKIAILALISCLAVACRERVPAADDSEYIQGFRVEENALFFTVFSHGYTSESSFRLDVARKGLGYEVELVRIEEDFGKMVPEPIEISFSQEELGDRLDLRKWIIVKNKLSSAENW